METTLQKNHASNTPFKGLRSLYSAMKILAIGSIGAIAYLYAQQTYSAFLTQTLHEHLAKIGTQEFTIDHRTNGKSEKMRLSNSDLQTVEALLFQEQYETETCNEKLKAMQDILKN